MDSLEAELARARSMDAAEIADAIESIGFECTRCGACCRGTDDDPHTATVFPDEIRRLQEHGYDWRDVARPMPFGLSAGDDGPEGETFEWALETDACGDCTFYDPSDGTATCTVYEDRPRICRTYPFSLALPGTDQPMGATVEREGPVRAHECEGLGRDIDRADAEALARALRDRAIHEISEAIRVRDAYEAVDRPPGAVVVHDSEGAKHADGTPIE